jgi:hypothetical protein
MPKSRAIATVAVTAACVVGVSAHAEGKTATRAPCELKSAVTIQANAEVRLFRRKGVVYACSYRTRKLMKFGDDIAGGCRDDVKGCVGVYNYVLAGRNVAYVVSDITRDSQESFVQVADVRRGRARTVWHGGDLAALPPAQVGVSDLVLRADGAVAWITRTGVQGVQGTRQEVHLANASGERTADPGPNVEIGSLALSAAGTVFWKNGTDLRSATFDYGEYKWGPTRTLNRSRGRTRTPPEERPGAAIFVIKRDAR